MVGRASARLRTVRSIWPGPGRPSSIHSVPPLTSTMFRSWLPPKVWLHGSQSNNTGGSSSRNGQTWRICCWLAISIPCELITPLGVPVDPEVNRILATSSVRRAAHRRSTSADGSAPKSPSVTEPGRSPSRLTTGRPCAIAATALVNAASSATTRPGFASCAIARSLAWSLLCRE
jgi:hypothetical protein